MNHLNIDSAAKCVKTIVFANGCFICDQLNLSSVRYPCGHTVCKNCLATQDYCLLCVTPPNTCNLIDESLNLRALHASELVTAFEDAFNIDVNRRPRISHKLKVEKLLFPKCIQAPMKYVNKRKSTYTLDKIGDISSSISILSGENTYRYSSKMENKNEYVYQWLNNNDSKKNQSRRKPLEDLSVNQFSVSNKLKNIVPHYIRKSSKSNKRLHTETVLSDINLKQKCFKKSKTQKETEITSRICNLSTSLEKSNQDQNESGIVIDDETVFIDDSQNEYSDYSHYNSKTNREAKLSNITNTFPNVLDAKKNISLNVVTDVPKPPNKYAVNSCTHKISFYKRSSLVSYEETCKLCCEFHRHVNKKDNFNKINVLIDSKAFIASINVSNCVTKKTCALKRKSIAVQTDITSTCLDMSNTNVITKVIEKNDLEDVANGSKVQDDTSVCSNIISKGDNKNMQKPKNTKKLNLSEEQRKNESIVVPNCLVIEDSDISDTDSSKSNNEKEVVEVSADVHRSCSLSDYEVLNTLHPDEYEHRNRHAGREHTPVSTDSSDKENYDPNRIRQTKNRGKKCEFKK